MKVIWFLIVFYANPADPSLWPGATMEHLIPEDYPTRQACEQGRIVLRLANPAYVARYKDKDLQIVHSTCIPVPVKGKS